MLDRQMNDVIRRTATTLGRQVLVVDDTLHQVLIGQALLNHHQVVAFAAGSELTA